MRKTDADVHAAIDEFIAAGAVGTFFANRMPNGEWFTWVQQIIKLHEMKPAVAAALRLIAAELGTNKIEMLEKDSKLDRVKVSRDI